MLFKYDCNCEEDLIMNKKLKEIIISIYGKDIDISEITSLSEELSFTSIHFVRLIVELEEAFGFEFADEDIDLTKLDCVGNLNKIVCSHV